MQTRANDFGGDFPEIRTCREILRMPMDGVRIGYGRERKLAIRTNVFRGFFC
jgi:hypothetical protein